MPNTENIDDRLYYRRAVVKLMRDNKEKYPATNECIAISFLNGTITTTADLFGDVLDSAFLMNMPIAECAKMVEDTCLFARNKAEQAYAQYKQMDPTVDPNETRH